MYILSTYIVKQVETPKKKTIENLIHKTCTDIEIMHKYKGLTKLISST